ncbi:hypothetical protein Tco_0752098 [Tanacetum coccineum]|uniref:MAK10-like protein n=1 Tax=Tanacetum coccineum TaxID=301880 RepID=A0ABQ4Z963_9ASTR
MIQPEQEDLPKDNPKLEIAVLRWAVCSSLRDRPATPEPAWTIPSSDLSIPTNNWASALKSSYAPPQDNSLLAQTGDMATFMDWFCKQRGISELTPKDLEGPAFEIVKVFHHDVIHLQFQMEECHKLLTDQVDDAIIRYNVSKPLPLGGEPGHVTIQPDFFFNKDLEYLRYGRKVGRPALSISKMKAAYYPDVGLEQLVPDQFWIAEECKYDIAAMYGISHWWVQRQRFYIDRFSSEGDRRAVRTHMRILSVVQIEVFSMYGYNYMKKIVLRRADLKEYVIAERDFKHMYPSDFEDLYLLNLQGHLNHLSPEHKKILTTAVNLWTRNLVIRHRVEDFQLGIESYQTQLNLTKPRWEATGFEFKHDYTVIDSPRVVTFRDRYGVQMIMRFNEIHKFNDGTLQQINEALDYREQGLHVRYPKKAKDTMYLSESGELCGWTDPRRRLPEIRLKMNLPDHRIKQKWRWRHLVPVESIHHPMLTLNASKVWRRRRRLQATGRQDFYGDGIINLKMASGRSRLKTALEDSTWRRRHDYNMTSNAEESWALLEDLALFDNESWNDPRDFAKSVKAVSLPQDVPSISDRRLIELENHVQRLMEAHLTPKQPIQVNKITSSCEICSSPHDTQYCLINPEQAFVDYASLRTDEVGGLVSNFMASQEARLSKFEADFKQQQSKMTNKIDTVFKSITDRITGTLPSDTIKNPKLNVNSTSLDSSARSYPTVDPQCSSHPYNSINAVKNEFKDLHLNLPVLEVLAHAPMYNAILDKYVESLELGKNRPAFIQGEMPKKMEDPGLFTLPCRDVEVHIRRLILLTDFYVINIKKDPETPLLVGRGFLATANAVIDCRKAKIVVGEGITRLVFGVKGIELCQEEAPYWTTIGRRESYKPQPSADGVGAKTLYYARKDFLDCYLLREWEIARDVEINPFKDVLIFKRMVEFLGAIPINLERNVWESEDLIKSLIN